MKKNSRIYFYAFLLVCVGSNSIHAQIAGDFRTSSTATFTGNWISPTSWERFNGSTWDVSGSGSNNPGQIPTSTSSVWIQTASLITLTQNVSCNDLNICNSTTSSISGSLPGRVALQTYTLSVNGKLSSYYGTLTSIPGTISTKGFPYYPFTGSTGKLSIVGNTRNLTISGEWGATITNTANGYFPLEINLNSNQTVTIVPNIKCTALSVLAGTLNTDSTISIDNGTDGQGDITIFDGATISCSASGTSLNIFQRTGTKRCGTLTINSGGTLTVLGGTPRMDVNAIVLNGTVNYSNSGNQKFLQKNNDASSTDIISYTNIILSGSGTKTTPASLTTTINGKLSKQGSAILALGTSAFLAYGTNGTLEFAGISLQTISSSSYEWPNTNGPINLSINNANGISLSVAKTITGNINLNSGNFNANNNLTITSSGSIIYNGGSITGFTLPSTLNSYTLNTGTTSLSSDLSISGTLALGNNTLDIGSHTLYLNGDFTTGTGVLKSNGTSSVNIGGTGTLSNQLLFDQSTSGTTNRLQNFIVNRGTSSSTGSVTLGNTLEITGTLTLSNGTFNTGGVLTLVSNASGTARIENISISADISGNVKVQRYVPAVVRQYRLISPNTASFTLSDLKDDIFVSGAGGTANGFDYTTNNGATVYTYHESTTGGRGWKAATNITNSLSPAQGALVYVRGNRTLSSPAWYTQNNSAYPSSGGFPAQNAVTIDFNGNINKDAISPTITYTNTGSAGNDGWNLVGNPYPSQISWGALTKSNLDSWYYFLDPSTGSYIADNGSKYIASGQAFFVQAIGASPSISFSEGAKVSSSPTNYFKSADPQIEFKLVKDSFNSDISIISFNSSSSKDFVRGEDALKLSNLYINMGFYIDNTHTLQFSSVPHPNTADTFILTVSAAAGTYSIQWSSVSVAVSSSKNVYLHDLYNNNLIDMRSNTEYSFSISSNSATSGKRFQLIMIDPTLLPITWLSFNGEKINSRDVLLSWKTASERNNSHFVIERSSDDITFSEIGLVNCIGNSSSALAYNFSDKNVFNADIKKVYYRIKQVDVNGRSEYSVVISVDANEVANTVSLFPNPANEILAINLPSVIHDNILIELYNSIGALCLNKNVFVANSNEIFLSVSSLINGVYTLVITEHLTNNKTISKFIKN